MEFWVLLAVTFVFVGLFAFMRNERIRRRLFCPLKKTTAEVDLVQRYHEPGRPIRIKTCDLLPNPKHVDCGQTCIHQAI
jgi:hypothetical protein